MRHIALLSLILAITFSSWANAQFEEEPDIEYGPNTGMLWGYVFDTNRNAISKAVVQYQQITGGNARGEVVADWAGNFVILAVPTGNYTLNVSKKGYLPKENISVRAVAGDESIIPLMGVHRIKVRKKAGLLTRLFERLPERKKKENQEQILGIAIELPFRTYLVGGFNNCKS